MPSQLFPPEVPKGDESRTVLSVFEIIFYSVRLLASNATYFRFCVCADLNFKFIWAQFLHCPNSDMFWFCTATQPFKLSWLVMTKFVLFNSSGGWLLCTARFEITKNTFLPNVIITNSSMLLFSNEFLPQMMLNQGLNQIEEIDTLFRSWKLAFSINLVLLLQRNSKSSVYFFGFDCDTFAVILISPCTTLKEQLQKNLAFLMDQCRRNICLKTAFISLNISSV